MQKEPELLRMLQLAEAAGSSATSLAARSLRRRIEEAVAAFVRATWEGSRPLTDREARLAGLRTGKPGS